MFKIFGPVILTSDLYIESLYHDLYIYPFFPRWSLFVILCILWEPFQLPFIT